MTRSPQPFSVNFHDDDDDDEEQIPLSLSVCFQEDDDDDDDEFKVVSVNFSDDEQKTSEEKRVKGWRMTCLRVRINDDDLKHDGLMKEMTSHLQHACTHVYSTAEELDNQLVGELLAPPPPPPPPLRKPCRQSRDPLTAFLLDPAIRKRTNFFSTALPPRVIRMITEVLSRDYVPEETLAPPIRCVCDLESCDRRQCTVPTSRTDPTRDVAR